MQTIGKNLIHADYVSDIDPTIAPGIDCPRGTLYRFIPNPAGTPVEYFKVDDGLSTNFVDISAAAGGGGANQQLSNLIAPTALNEDVLGNISIVLSDNPAKVLLAGNNNNYVSMKIDPAATNVDLSISQNMIMQGQITANDLTYLGGGVNGRKACIISLIADGGVLRMDGDLAFICGQADNNGVATNNGSIRSALGSFIMAYANGGSVRATNLGFVQGQCTKPTLLDSAQLNALSAGAMARGVVVTGSISASSFGSTAVGVTSTDASISASGPGSYASGQADGSGSISANSPGCFSSGLADASGQILSVQPGSVARGKVETDCQITSAGFGARASGHALSTSVIYATASGSTVFGRAENNSLLEAAAFGAQAFGSCVDNATISASEIGATAYGLATASGQILSQGNGSSSHGQAINSGIIISGTGPSSGDHAHGLADGVGSLISALGNGSHSHGIATAGALIRSSNGSHAFGAADAAASEISAVGGVGSLAFGSVSAGSQIISSGTGSVAHGIASGANNITSSGQGSVAYGVTSGFNIQALGHGSHAAGFAAVGAISVTGTAAFAHGDNHTISHDRAVAFGIGHVSTQNNQFLVGSYCDTSLSPRFAVGNGVVGVPSNAFEVSPVGNYKTYGTQTKKTNLVSVFDYVISSVTPDDLVVATTSAPAQIVRLPPAPVMGETYSVKVAAASTDPLTLSGNGFPIDGNASITLNTPGTETFALPSAVTVTFDGTEWQIIGKG